MFGKEDKMADVPSEVTDAVKGTDDIDDAKKDSFLVISPGQAYGPVVVAAVDKQDAVNQVVEINGIAPVLDEEGNNAVALGVVKLETVKVSTETTE
jgi:hypothetical protein